MSLFTVRKDSSGFSKKITKQGMCAITRRGYGV